MQLQQLEVDNKMDPVKIQQLKQSLRDKAQSVRGDIVIANMNHIFTLVTRLAKIVIRILSLSSVYCKIRQQTFRINDSS